MHNDIGKKDGEYTIELTDGRSIVRAITIFFIMGVVGMGTLVAGAALLGNTSVARASDAATGFFSNAMNSAGSAFQNLLASVPDRENKESILATVQQNPPVGGLVVVEAEEKEEEASGREEDESAKDEDREEAEEIQPEPKPQPKPRPKPAPVDVVVSEPEVIEEEEVQVEPTPVEDEEEPIVEDTDPIIIEPDPEPAPTGPTHAVTIIKYGAGDVVLQSTDYHISCGNVCSYEYPHGTVVSFSAYPENDAEFFGWGNVCSGSGTCGILVTGPTTITASAGRIYTQLEPEPDDPRRSGGGSGWVIVSEVMPGSTKNANDEFIELYNPTDTPIALSGWRILRKNSDGSETQLVPSSVFEGKIVPAKGHFLIGHGGSYQGVVVTNAMWPSLYALRYSDDAIVLYDGIGTKVEEIHWEHVPVGRSWTRNSSDEQVFYAAVQTPQNSSN